MAKIQKKEGKNHKIKKNYKNYQILFTNGSKVRSFQGVTPLTPNFFRNPHLLKLNPAYAPGCRIWIWNIFSVYVGREVLYCQLNWSLCCQRKRLYKKIREQCANGESVLIFNILLNSLTSLCWYIFWIPVCWRSSSWLLLYVHKGCLANTRKASNFLLFKHLIVQMQCMLG